MMEKIGNWISSVTVSSRKYRPIWVSVSLLDLNQSRQQFWSYTNVSAIQFLVRMLKTTLKQPFFPESCDLIVNEKYFLFKVAKSNFRVILNSKETLLVNFNIQSLFYIINEITEGLSNGLLICTLISENPGLEKLRSILNLRKFLGPAQLNFFKYT